MKMTKTHTKETTKSLPMLHLTATLQTPIGPIKAIANRLGLTELLFTETLAQNESIAKLKLNEAASITLPLLPQESTPICTVICEPGYHFIEQNFVQASDSKANYTNARDTNAIDTNAIITHASGSEPSNAEPAHKKHSQSATPLHSSSFPDAQSQEYIAISHILTNTLQQLSEYFAKARRQFELPLAPEGSAFQQQVWQSLQQIEFGQTCSYADIADAIANPKAVRAVGAANGRNPLAIVIPCHRVVGQNGSMTGYAGGLSRKVWLLQHEKSFCSA